MKVVRFVGGRPLVDAPAGLAGCGGRPPPAPAGSLHRKGTQGQLFVGRDRWRQALGGAGLIDHRTGSTFRYPELLSEGDYGPPAAVRGQKFPRFSSLSMSMSRAWSATIRLRRTFSVLRK